MTSVLRLKKLIILSIIISFVASLLNMLGILRISLGANSGNILDLGGIIGFIFAIIAIRLVVRIPEKQPI